jgi:Inner membrane component of T3SS, cytoplasmic domain
MIWVEILSRQRDVAQRFGIASPEVRIGRGYDNDVVVDDPYVAATHLRVFRDESGSLLAEDMGSANGTFLDGKKRLARFVIDGKQPIRIGQTYLRVRDINYAVERERIASPERRISPVVLDAVLGVAVLVISALRIWLAETSEPRASNYLVLLTLIATVLIWAGIWALLSRIFSGHSNFPRHLLIVLAGMVALLFYEEIAQFSAFGLTWSVASTYQYVAVWLILAVVCFFHLRVISPTRLVMKGTIVGLLLATAIATQALQRSEAFFDYGRQYATHQLMPPSFRVVPFRDENAFFADVQNLKAKLDGDRAAAKRNDLGR